MAFITGQTNRRISSKEATDYLVGVVAKQGEEGTDQPVRANAMQALWAMKLGSNGGCGVRQRGRFILGATSPYVSGTRGPTSTPYCRLGPRAPEHAS